MALRPRTTILLVVIGIAAVAGAAVAATYPRLSDSRDSLEGRWRALRSELSDRYDAAERLAAVIVHARPDLAPAADLGEAVNAWSRAGTSPDAGARAANRVEGLAARVVGIVEASASLRSDGRVVDAVRAFVSISATQGVERYASAVEGYDRARNRFPGPWLASLLGFDAVAVVDIPGAFDDVELPPPSTSTSGPATTTSTVSETG